MKTIRIKECDIVVCCEPFEDDLKKQKIWLEFIFDGGMFGPIFKKDSYEDTIEAFYDEEIHDCPHCEKEIEVR